MRVGWTGALMVSLAAMAACESKQTPFDRDMHLLCSAPSRLRDEIARVPPEQRMLVVMRDAAKQITDPEVRKMLGEVASATTQDKEALIASAAKRAGISHCDVLDLWH